MDGDMVWGCWISGAYRICVFGAVNCISIQNAWLTPRTARNGSANANQNSMGE